MDVFNTNAPTNLNRVKVQVGVSLSVIGFLIEVAISVYKWHKNKKDRRKEKAKNNFERQKLNAERVNGKRDLEDMQFHFYKADIMTRGQAEEHLKEAKVGAFIIRGRPNKDDGTKVISVVTLRDTQTNPPKVRMLHGVLSRSSSARREWLLHTGEDGNQKIRIGSNPATTLREACVAMSRDPSILGVALVGVEDENVYSEAVAAPYFRSQTFVSKVSCHAGVKPAPGRCSTCGIKRTQCTCNASREEKQMARLKSKRSETQGGTGLNATAVNVIYETNFSANAVASNEIYGTSTAEMYDDNDDDGDGVADDYEKYATASSSFADQSCQSQAYEEYEPGAAAPPPPPAARPVSYINMFTTVESSASSA